MDIVQKQIRMASDPVTTGKPSWDWLKLGRTSGKRSAEIVAGLRTLPVFSLEDKALSTPMARWFARLLAGLVNDEPTVNATAGRHFCMTELAQEVLYRGSPPRTIVELAAGFSGRGLLLARAFPEADVIEVDLPEVVAAKQERIRCLVNGKPPQNLHWVSADLSEVQLAKVLEAQDINLVIAEGVLPYFPPDLIIQTAASVRQCLAADGVMLADITSSRDWQEVAGKSKLATWLFKSQIASFKGMIEDGAEAQQWFRQAGYGQIILHPLRQLAHKYLPNVPVAGVSFIIEAHEGGAATS